MLTTTTLFLKLQKFLERLYTYDLFNQHTHHRYFHAIFPKVEIGNFFWTPFTDRFFRSFNYFFFKTKITINHKHSSDTGMLLQVLELPNLFTSIPWFCHQAQNTFAIPIISTLIKRTKVWPFNKMNVKTTSPSFQLICLSS